MRAVATELQILILDCARREFSEYCDPFLDPEEEDPAVDGCWKDNPLPKGEKNDSVDDDDEVPEAIVDVPENRELVEAADVDVAGDMYDVECD